MAAFLAMLTWRWVVLASGAILVGLLAGTPAGAADPSGNAPQSLAWNVKPGDTTRVELTLEVGGDLSLTDGAQVRKVKMSVLGSLAYDERYLAPEAELLHSVRRYELAQATIKVDAGGVQPQLSPQRRLIAARAEAGESLLYSPSGCLTRDELDLIDVPINSLLVDRLLPAEAVAVGGSWKHDDKLMGLLLCLDVVNQSDITSTLVEIDDEAARIEMGGLVQGGIGGVATDIELKGRYKYDRRQGRITWIAVLVKEKRSIGHIGPGIDAVARLQMRITPCATPVELTDEHLLRLELNPTAELLQLAYTSTIGGFRFEHDRRWHVMHDEPNSLAMRMVDRGELVAQCNLSPLAPAEPGQVATLEAFQTDIRRSLSKQFGQFVRARESRNARGYVEYQVEVTGVVSELPIRWKYYLLGNDRGQQVVIAFTAEENLAQLMGGADEAIVSTLEFDEPAEATAGLPTPAAVDSGTPR